jgi:hypothetical protein
LVTTATGKAKAKQKDVQKALLRFTGTRAKMASEARAAKSKSARGQSQAKAKRIEHRPAKKFAGRPKKSDSLGAPDSDVQPEAPELTPADMDDDVQITDVVTAADRDAAARAAAETLDDDDDDEDDQEPEPVVPKPVKSEVFDLTEEEDPGGIIASAMGSDDQNPVVNEPMLIPAGGDDQPMQADKPVNDLKLLRCRGSCCHGSSWGCGARRPAAAGLFYRKSVWAACPNTHRAGCLAMAARTRARGARPPPPRAAGRRARPTTAAPCHAFGLEPG